MYNSRKVTAVIVAIAMLVGIGFSVLAETRMFAASARPRQFQDNRQYADEVRRTYSFHFGKDGPFLPSNALIEGDDFVDPGTFPTAAYCGHCHAAAYQQWQQSLHRNSFREPFYVKNVNLLSDTKGVEFSRHCEGCHNPIALLSGAVTPTSHVNRRFDDDGVTCSVCHSIEKLQPMYGNGAYVMGIPAAIVDEQGKPIAGEVPFREILEHPDRHRKAVMKDFYKSPEFCGSCHKSTIPQMLNDYRWVRGFGTYDEWQASALSNRNPVPFYQRPYTTCQNCHMAREDAGPGEYGAKNGTIASHRWLGGNTAAPFYYGFNEQVQKTVAFLQNETLNVDIFALKKPESSDLIAPSGATSFNLAAGDLVQVFVVIQNKGLGHSLIPEQRDFYEAWVEFTVRDSIGREIYHSGYLKPDGSLDDRAHSFTNRLVGEDSRLLSEHEIWKRRAVAFDNTILPGRSSLVRYEFRIPWDASDSVSVTARVNYRHFNQEYLNYVLGPAHPAYPIAEMASQSRTLTIGDNPVAARTTSSEQPEWLRWNNFGIALLEQGQYSDAVGAFSRVVKLRPDYTDGYTNIALADLNWEKYKDAKTAVEQALGIALRRSGTEDSDTFPQSRALFYRALIERNLGDLNAAVADLEQVAKRFPLSRDAIRELGLSYYLTHEDHAALEQFEALQANDPDDVLCHFYLAILYRRAGMIEAADEQSRLYNEKRDDQEAPTKSELFIRAHPDADLESLPYHMHLLPEKSVTEMKAQSKEQ